MPVCSITLAISKKP